MSEYVWSFVVALLAVIVLLAVWATSPTVRSSIFFNGLLGIGFRTAEMLVPQAMWNEWIKTWNMGCMMNGGQPPGSTPLWYYFCFPSAVIQDAAWLTIPILFVVRALGPVDRH